MTSGKVAAARRAQQPRRITTEATAADHAPPGDSFDPRAWVDQYEPTSPSVHWPTVATFVRTTLHSLLDHLGTVGVDSLRRYCLPLRLLAEHTAASGTTLSVRALLDPLTINQFFDRVQADGRHAARQLSARERPDALVKVERTAASYRSKLRRIGRLLNPEAPWEPAPVRTYRQQRAPHTEAEIAAFWAQVPTLTPERGRCATALLVMGLGAGLDGRWAGRVQVKDVIDDGDGLLIRLADRVVPVLVTYEQLLRDLIDGADPDELLIGGTARHANVASEAVNRLHLDRRGPRLDLSRLRAAWLVHHLSVGTRVPELMEAAGLTTMTSLGDLAEFVPDLCPDPEQSVAAARAMLRGRSGAVR